MLDIRVQSRRNASAARRFFKPLLAGLKHKPRRLVTDGLRSYGIAHRELLPEAKHRTNRYLNNRAENSHWPTGRRERQMQRFLSAHAFISGHFRPRRHLLPQGRSPRHAAVRGSHDGWTATVDQAPAQGSGWLFFAYRPFVDDGYRRHAGRLTCGTSFGATSLGIAWLALLGLT